MIDNTQAKGFAILRDYIKQMRAAGYPDATIKRKIMENPTITIPEDISGYGGDTWTGGMFSEFKGAVPDKSMAMPAQNITGVKRKLGEVSPNWLEDIPSVSDYILYKQGQTANRLPSYGEAAGLEGTTGKFGQTKRANLMQALANYLANYRGAKVAGGMESYKLGIAGLPQELANQWMPEITARQEAQTKYETETADKKQKNINLSLQYPEVDININDTYENNISKITQYKKKAAADKTTQEVIDLKLNSMTDEEKESFYSGISNGKTIGEMLGAASAGDAFLTIAEINFLYKKLAPKWAQGTKNVPQQWIK